MDSHFFREENNCIFINVKVQTRSSKNEVKGVRGDELLISTTVVPENGKANDAIIKILSKELGIAKSKISLISGKTNHSKVFCVDGLSSQDITKTNWQKR